MVKTMIEIKEKLTPYNFTAMSDKRNEYIVVHYVGEVSTAKNNATYFYNNDLRKSPNPASAHYFVDENDIYQVVRDKDKAWHTLNKVQGNGGRSFLGKCTNSNSIGVELCCKKRGNDWYFEEKTIKNAVELIRHLMDKHNIPIERVIRHYDVTGKICPAPLIDEGKWAEFKEKIEEGDPMTAEEQRKFNALVKEVENLTLAKDRVYHYTEELPDWARPTIQKLLDKKLFVGASKSDLDLPETLMRVLVINDRAGMYK